MDLGEAGHYCRLAAGCPGKPTTVGVVKRNEHATDICNGNESPSESGVPLRALVSGAIYERSMAWQSFENLKSLGRWLEFGDYADKDINLSAKCYRAAAKEGHSDAQANCGFSLEHGLGVQRNMTRSLKWYAKSMKQKNPVGAGHYARSIHFGCGCCEDVESALDHYDTVTETHPWFFSDNSDRCLRGLNKLPSPKEEVERGQTAGLPSSTTVLDIADLIVRYKLDPIMSLDGEVLGAGSFGRVTREKDPRNPENRIAVKHLEHADWNRFVGEIATLVKLQHPCIVQILGWSRVSSNSFDIWMQLGANGPLRDHLPEVGEPIVDFCGIQLRKPV
jgi:hypothetical protein